MVELKGSLSGIGLPAIVQLIGELRHTGSLELSKGATHGVLDFDDGRLVAASLAENSGFKALAKLSLEMADGEFTFVEGVPVHERTLDLGIKDLQAYLKRVANGEDFAEAVAKTPAAQPELASLGACPLLGFADDRARHYSRPTALHRCFATGAPSLVSGQEQRELCLAGTYPNCARYQSAAPTLPPVPAAAPADSSPPTPVAPIAGPPPTSAPPRTYIGPPTSGPEPVGAPPSASAPSPTGGPPAPVPPQLDGPTLAWPVPIPVPVPPANESPRTRTPAPTPAASVPPRASTPLPIDAPPAVNGGPPRTSVPPSVAAPPERVVGLPPPADTMRPTEQAGAPRQVPPGVAARMASASASAMSLGGSANNNTDAPTWIGQARPEVSDASGYHVPGRPVGPRLRRALLLVGIGVVAGLVLVVGVVLVSMPALNNGLTAQKPTVAGAQAFSPVATLVRAPATATAPDQAAAKPTAPAAAAPRPTTAPAPTATSASRAQTVPNIAPTAQPPNTTAAGAAQSPTTAQPPNTTAAGAAQSPTSAQPPNTTAAGAAQSPTTARQPNTTTAGPAQSPTTAQPQGATAAGAPLLDVRFATGPGKGWLDDPTIAAWSDGAYRLQARQPARFVAIGAPLAQMLSDVVISATFRKTGGPPGGGYGLIVRDQGPSPRDGANQIMNAFVLEAGDLGEFGIWRRDGDRWVDLVAWTRSAAVRMGGSPNDLTARAVGNRLTLTINGTQVASIEDGAPMAGGVGIFIGGDYNEVALDRFTVQAAD